MAWEKSGIPFRFIARSLFEQTNKQTQRTTHNDVRLRIECACLFLSDPTGILIYEMLAGYPPFFDDNPFGIYEKILAGKIDWPRHMDPIAKDLVKKLLVQDRTKRLGNMKVCEIIKKRPTLFFFFFLKCLLTNEWLVGV